MKMKPNNGTTMPPPNKMSRATTSQFASTVPKRQMGNTATSAKPWPPKYEPKHEKLKEIPKECVEKLLTAIDKDLDGKVGLDELINFVRNIGDSKLTTEMVKDMFKEITDRRKVVFDSQISAPITLSELLLCCTNFYLFVRLLIKPTPKTSQGKICLGRV